jgi:glutaredoxin-like protein NrdH
VGAVKTITVYSKPGCVQCNAVKKWLGKRGIEHAVVDVTQSPADLAALKELGYEAVPVTFVSNGDPETDLHFYGFNDMFLEKYCTEAVA